MKPLGVVLLVIGAILVVWGSVGIGTMLGVDPEEQRGYVARIVYPLVVGMWLFIGGVYSLQRR